MLCLFPVELLARVFGVVDEELAGPEALAVNFLEAAHLIDEFVGAEKIDEAEGTSQLRRETQTEYCANVTLQLQRTENLTS